jgi:hypothetical protein
LYDALLQATDTHNFFAREDDAVARDSLMAAEGTVTDADMQKYESVWRDF